MPSVSQTPDPAELLDAFLSSGGSEQAFSALADQLGPLVYSSAIRRTGDCHLAQDITQTVFTVLARKAPSLRHHPSLLAWVYQTTRLEAAKAMRTECRRQRALEAFARESITRNGPPLPPSEIVAWKDAVPVIDESLDRLAEKDRQLVLERFYQERTFAEIAARTGSTEAACKMRLKRALRKLAAVLKSRGVTLTATTIASSLGAELSRAAPTAMSTIASNALAASTNLTTSSIIIHSIQTMSVIKTATLTSAAVLILASAPLIWQQAQANILFGKLEELESYRRSLETQRQPVTLLGSIGERSGPASIRDLLAASLEPLTAQKLIDSMPAINDDPIARRCLQSAIAHLTPAEHERLLMDVIAINEPATIKNHPIQLLVGLAPPSNHKAALEKLINMDFSPYGYSNLMYRWARHESDSAYEWYEDKVQAAELLDEGMDYQSPNQVLLGKLIEGMAENDLDRALELIKDLQPGYRVETLMNVSMGLAAEVKSTGDDSEFQRFLEVLEDQDKRFEESERFRAVTAALDHWTRSGELNEGLAFAKRYLIHTNDHQLALVSLVASPSAALIPFNERAEWLMSQTHPDDGVAMVRKWMEKSLLSDFKAAANWLVSQPNGELRDRCLEELVSREVNSRSFQDAYKHAQQILDDERRHSSLDRLTKSWLAIFPDDARESLPPELINEVTDESPDA